MAHITRWRPEPRTIFRRRGGCVQPLHAFGDGEGRDPRAALLEVGGTFYGRRWLRLLDLGTIYTMTPTGTVRVATSDTDGATQGWLPCGMTARCMARRSGGPLDRGTFFRMTTNGAVSVLHAFGAPPDVDRPWRPSFKQPTPLLMARQISAGTRALARCSVSRRTGLPPCCTRFLEAATVTTRRVTVAGDRREFLRHDADEHIDEPHGGPGTIFRMTSGGFYSRLYTFPDSGGFPTRLPTSGLIQARDGQLYGTTWTTVCRISLDGTFATFHSFDARVEGFNPQALVSAPDGSLFGTTSTGGPLGMGTVFRMTLDGLT
jgi:uncharacterized repeat protein (TIGR03803 family)